MGVVVTLEWHVFAGGRWRVADEPVGRVPVNVETAVGRWEPVAYRHRAGTCPGTCVLSCGHTVGYGCDCDTITAEAAQGDDPVRPVLRLVCSRCGDVRPDADVMGEGVSLGARCGYVDCSGVYRDVR